jgi:hypothetical protein
MSIDKEKVENDCRLWLTVANSGACLEQWLAPLSDEELRTWVEVASDMDIPRERKQTVARVFNQR